MSIPDHRKAIDKLDGQIVHLLNERTRHVLEIGKIKLKSGDSIYAPHRERAVFQRLAKINEGPMTNESLRAIYREVMSSALSLEKSMVIAYLGPEATFTHQAAIQKFGSSLKYAAQKTIADVFTEVGKNRADYGVVPVENSTEGVVSHTLDMFVDSPLQIVAQIVLPIQYCLAGNEEFKEAQQLYAHPQALAQCRIWVQKNLPKAEILETSSNARSAELVAPRGAIRTRNCRRGSRPSRDFWRRIRISSKSSSATFRISVIMRRGFWCWAGRVVRRADTTARASCSALRMKWGRCTARWRPFRKFRLNMTKIESRPTKRKAWEYLFFVDCDGHYEDRKVAQAIESLKRVCNFVKVLGSYPDGE